MARTAGPNRQARHLTCPAQPCQLLTFDFKQHRGKRQQGKLPSSAMPRHVYPFPDSDWVSPRLPSRSNRQKHAQSSDRVSLLAHFVKSVFFLNLGKQTTHHLGSSTSLPHLTNISVRPHLWGKPTEQTLFCLDLAQKAHSAPLGWLLICSSMRFTLPVCQLCQGQGEWEAQFPLFILNHPKATKYRKIINFGTRSAIKFSFATEEPLLNPFGPVC